MVVISGERCVLNMRRGVHWIVIFQVGDCYLLLSSGSRSLELPFWYHQGFTCARGQSVTHWLCSDGPRNQGREIILAAGTSRERRFLNTTT